MSTDIQDANSVVSVAGLETFRQYGPQLKKGKAENSTQSYNSKAISTGAIALEEDNIAGCKAYKVDITTETILPEGKEDKEENKYARLTSLTITEFDDKIFNLFGGASVTEQKEVQIPFCLVSTACKINESNQVEYNALQYDYQLSKFDYKKEENSIVLSNFKPEIVLLNYKEYPTSIAGIGIDKAPFITNEGIDEYNNSNLTEKLVYNTIRSPEYPTYGIENIGDGAYTEGSNNISGPSSHVEGAGNMAAGKYAHIEGIGNIGVYASHVEGKWNKALGLFSHVEGQNNIATSNAAHVEGNNNKALAPRAHAEGEGTEASGAYSHSQNVGTYAIGEGSTAMGWDTRAEGRHSVSEGRGTHAKANRSHAAGTGTIASVDSQFVVGKYNAEDTNALFLVGGGSTEKRKNLFKIGSNGVQFYSQVFGDYAITTTNTAAGSKAFLNSEHKMFLVEVKGANSNKWTNLGMFILSSDRENIIPFSSYNSSNTVYKGLIRIWNSGTSFIVKWIESPSNVPSVTYYIRFIQISTTDIPSY